MKTLAEFIQENQLTMRVKRIKVRPDNNTFNTTRNFECKIESGNMRGKIIVLFSQGEAHKKNPTLGEVLSSLADESASVDSHDTFEEWAGEYGYDTDSRKVERIYNECKRQSLALWSFLGPSAYRTLVENTERL